ncbi:MAG TPA: bifunctional [glutamine synthetase] adenylyltransferase/[glutamine synthetase]-adenylyl-L-tyrosine phosphorylase [Acidimicrobiales bacterium]|nr:bifunctional [glutamine synthetase] adenylyltransferase/[glutamine synthetase]-adenylyl-L-tyrosine phosphorylase [Acidimicrobiales bacterium]
MAVAAPAVSVALDRLRDARPAIDDELAADDALHAALVAVVEASRSLTRLVLARPDDALAQLRDLDARAAAPTDGVDALVAWKRIELLRIAARDLTGVDVLEATGGALARMAADVLASACAIAGANGTDLAVIGMGKLGGSELNYASDVDVVFVGGDDAAARAVVDVARHCFRVDTDLRPEGRDGALTRTLDSYEAYWDRWADAWEFQALLKARPVAGDGELGQAFAEAAAARLWSRTFTADDIRSLRTMKARSEHEVDRRRLDGREVKRGRGGIRDIEFAVQLLQLVHGRHDPGLRSPTTLDALAELSGAGYVDPADAGALEDAYRFLRAVEHRLQLVDEQQTHALPGDADGAARERLARTMRFADDPQATAVERLDDALRLHRATVRSIHERLYFRPLLEAFSAAGGRLTPDAARDRLAAFGFADADRTRQALAELTRGLTRSSRLMQQLLPLLLEWLSDSPDPDLGLLGMRRLAGGGTRQAAELVTAFRDSPEVARRLCCLLGTSRLLTDTIARNPDLIPDLVHLDRTPRLPAPGIGARPEALARLVRRETVRIAARDVFAVDDVAATGRALTDLAEGVVAAALDALQPPVPFAVIGMGRLGGTELSYASDLDVVFVYDGASPDDFEAAERTAADLLTALRDVYAVDADLRPEGRQGPLARSLDGFRSYYDRWAQTWERQALVRARPTAGDADVAARFMAIVEDVVWERVLTDDATRDIRRMKARVERERIPPGEDPEFHLKLGRGSLSDVEWTAQLLQLKHRVPATSTAAALDALAAAGALGVDDARALADAYRFCERTRNRWFLVKGAPGDALPTQPEQLGRLARSLDTTASELRDDYRRVTRRARAVVERVFYGKV